MVQLTELVEGLEETQLSYWSDPYMKHFRAHTLSFLAEKKRKVYIILDKTIFHPKSGGQPSDRGFIYGSDFKVNIKKAMLVKGVVVHWGKILEGEPSNTMVNGEIDWNWRLLLMRRHTAGHLYDHCLTKVTSDHVETTDSWLGDPCFVGYRGKKPTFEELKKAESLENQMILKEGKVKSEVISYRELLDRAPEAPNIFRLPKLESFRIVTIEGCEPIPCGGTHLKNIKEIGRFKINEAVEVEDGFRVYYDIEDLK